MNYTYIHPKDNEIYWSPVPKPEEELCYFLEEQTGSWFVDHGIRFTNNPLKAKRFKTKRDAEKLFRGVAFPSCKVTEHLFIPDRSALKAFEDGLTVKYEDQEKVRQLLKCHESGWPNDVDCMWRDCPAKDGKCPLWHSGYPKDYDSDEFVGKTELEPGTCLPIEVEGKIIYKITDYRTGKHWAETTVEGIKKLKHYPYCDFRRVFRITK